MKLIIVCDGQSTHVFDTRSGEKLEQVRKVTFSHEAGGLPVASIEIVAPEIDITDTDVRVKELLKKS